MARTQAQTRAGLQDRWLHAAAATLHDMIVSGAEALHGTDNPTYTTTISAPLHDDTLILLLQASGKLVWS